MTESDKNNEAAVAAVEDEGEVLAWTSHPLRRKPLTAALVTLFILVVGFLVYVTTESKAFGTLALVVLFASLAKFYMPTKYRLTDKRIMVKSTTQTIYKNWVQFRSYYPDRSGILLSPFVGPSRLENFRGLYLIFEQNKEEVVNFVQARINARSEDDEIAGDTDEESK